MKVTALAIAQAFVDVAQTTSAADLPHLADAAAVLLVRQGLRKDARTFPSIVERVWQKREGVVPVRLTSVSGAAGFAVAEIAEVIRSSLHKPCVVEEYADPSILGGLLLRIGDERFDATIAGSLKALSDRLLQPITVLS